MRFALDRWGALYAFYKAYRHPLDSQQLIPPDFLIVKFHRDGSVDSRIKLSGLSGGQLEPTAFAVFGNGNILVTGTLVSKPPAPRTGMAAARPLKWRVVRNTPASIQPFTGIFDPSGNFIQRLNLPYGVSTRSAQAENSSHGLGGEAKGDWSMDMMGTVLIAAPDGNIYLFRPSHPAMLYSISPGGQILHQAQIEIPSGSSLPLAASMAGPSNLFLDFFGQQVGKNREIHSTTFFAFVDPTTGKVVGRYRLPPDSGNVMPACADSSSEILFLGSTKAGNLEVVKFSTE